MCMSHQQQTLFVRRPHIVTFTSSILQKPVVPTVTMHTHRHQDLFALVEQDGVLQRTVRDGTQRAAARRQGSQVEVEEPLDLAECQYEVASEGGAHKVLQLRPGCHVSILGVGGAWVTVDGAVWDGGGRACSLRGVHGLLRVAERLLLDAH